MAENEKPPSWLDLEKVIPFGRSKRKPEQESVEELTSLSEDTIIRTYSKYVVDLSPRRRGMKLKNALRIANGD
jgi:hypothetical protein